jgi:ActR/RegA family two-component response regulator
VTVSTLLVCDDTSKTDQLQSLIVSRPELKLTSAVEAAGAGERIKSEMPSLVWIELSPEPAKGLLLLGELREKYPSVQFLVSYDTLKADLVKTAMQLGAVEYIDPDSDGRLLPDAIERIHQKLNDAIMGSSTARPRVVASPTVAGDGSVQPDDSYVPGANAQNRPVAGGVRGKAAQLEGGPGSMPVWLLPALMIIMIIIAVAVFLTRH